jgi:hypothetical protein
MGDLQIDALYPETEEGGGRSVDDPQSNPLSGPGQT